MSFDDLKFGVEVVAGVVVLWLRGLPRPIARLDRAIGDRATEGGGGSRTQDTRRRGDRSALRRPPSPSPRAYRPSIVAAIAAAVAACGARVIHIADTATGHAWAAEGRWLQQTSHRLR